MLRILHLNLHCLPNSDLHHHSTQLPLPRWLPLRHIRLHLHAMLLLLHLLLNTFQAIHSLALLPVCFLDLHYGHLVLADPPWLLCWSCIAETHLRQRQYLRCCWLAYWNCQGVHRSMNHQQVQKFLNLIQNQIRLLSYLDCLWFQSRELVLQMMS